MAVRIEIPRYRKRNERFQFRSTWLRLATWLELIFVLGTAIVVLVFLAKQSMDEKIDGDWAALVQFSLLGYILSKYFMGIVPWAFKTWKAPDVTAIITIDDTYVSVQEGDELRIYSPNNIKEVQLTTTGIFIELGPAGVIILFADCLSSLQQAEALTEKIRSIMHKQLVLDDAGKISSPDS